jgi:hypothetical protein
LAFRPHPVLLDLQNIRCYKNRQWNAGLQMTDGGVMGRFSPSSRPDSSLEKNAANRAGQEKG